MASDAGERSATRCFPPVAADPLRRSTGQVVRAERVGIGGGSRWLPPGVSTRPTLFRKRLSCPT